MKKFFISLLVSLFAVCASNAQNPQLDIARELAAKLGIVISDSCSKHDVIKHSKAIINRALKPPCNIIAPFYRRGN